MPCRSLFSRIMLACLLLSAAAWVALPVLTLFDRGAGDESPGAAGAVVAEQMRSAAPRHVIREPEPGRDPAVTAEFHEMVAATSVGVSANMPSAASSAPPSVAVAPPDAAPLPPLPRAFSFRPPALDATYRSTLEIPPPPLLDAHAPPPVSLSRSVAAPADHPTSAVRGESMPSEYVIRDGDDLTSIAVRFYGNPAAAEAIWVANRDRLPDPKLLPIGRAVHLPPPNAVGLPTGRRERLIEPL